jgi:PPOX class probable F420-dependent enzyme
VEQEECRARFGAARVARLATVRPGGAPHLVPVTFAVVGDDVMFAVDDKPKTTTALQRLRNLVAHPQVSFLVDRYDDDWAALWWVRADAVAIVLDPGNEAARAEVDGALDALVAKYPQYARHRPSGPVVVSTVHRWTGWSWSG